MFAGRTSSSTSCLIFLPKLHNTRGLRDDSVSIFKVATLPINSVKLHFSLDGDGKASEEIRCHRAGAEAQMPRNYSTE